jgi:predicted metal-binding protein
MDEFPEIIALFLKSWMKVKTYLESASCSPPHTRKEVLRVLLQLAHNQVKREPYVHASLLKPMSCNLEDLNFQGLGDQWSKRSFAFRRFST